jgi:hypothetical protein
MNHSIHARRLAAAFCTTIALGLPHASGTKSRPAGKSKTSSPEEALARAVAAVNKKSKTVKWGRVTMYIRRFAGASCPKRTRCQITATIGGVGGPLEALDPRLHLRAPGDKSGSLKFDMKDLGKITNNPRVLQIAYGEESQVDGDFE